MVRKRTGRREVFTVEEANATLPLVRAITRDLSRLSREVNERRERLSHLLAGRQDEADNPYREELAQIERELAKDDRQLKEYVKELRALGAEPNDGAEGLVDFPARIDGRRAYLSWKLGEPEVLYWHEADAEYPQRRPLASRRSAERSQVSHDQ